MSEPTPTPQQSSAPAPNPEVHNTTIVKHSPKTYLVAALAAVLLFVIGIFVGLGMSTLGHHHDYRFEHNRPGIEQPQWRNENPGTDRNNQQGKQDSHRQFGSKESQQDQQNQQPDTQNQTPKPSTPQPTTK